MCQGFKHCGPNHLNRPIGGERIWLVRAQVLFLNFEETPWEGEPYTVPVKWHPSASGDNSLVIGSHTTVIKKSGGFCGCLVAVEH